MGHFTDETLRKFQEMCAEGLDFGEGPAYDFVQCLMPNGDIYGVEPGESCEKGRQISEKQADKLRGKNKKDDSPGTRMAKLKRAFLKKTGREMNDEELAKASWLVNNGK